MVSDLDWSTRASKPPSLSLKVKSDFKLNKRHYLNPCENLVLTVESPDFYRIFFFFEISQKIVTDASAAAAAENILNQFRVILL
jgi:hypothetical protein